MAAQHGILIKDSEALELAARSYSTKLALAPSRDVIQGLVANCHGNERPDCPIIAGIAQSP